MKQSRWKLTEEVEEKHSPIVKEFIKKIEEIGPDDQTDLLEIDLSDTDLNPYTLQKLLESFGYQETERDVNGWQFDFWITMEKSGFKSLQINVTGVTFELMLTEVE
ncbi:hypothetical protein [Bacillus subtilis]|uniref:hypothetical protein n=1 Tax=Bacillus subtilis TaxID=1423 RepID=UPI0021D85EFB|nr:hypothetical protein [Bacillus subtilis]